MQLVWFRDDLRVEDHPALYGASLAGGPLIGLYVASPAQWQSHDCGERKRQWHHANVEALRSALSALGIPLLIWREEQFSALPERLAAFCQRHRVAQLHFHRALGWNERQLERAVEDALLGSSTATVPYQDANLLDYDQVVTQQGGLYRVFTPFAKRCRQRLALVPPLPCPEAQSPLALPEPSDHWTESPLPLWPAGESVAHNALERFAQQRASGYDQQRDLPAMHGTSALSPYFAAGVLSPRQALYRLAERLGEPGTGAWVNELLWREFYRYLMHHHPGLSRHQAMYPAKQAPWQSNDEYLARWQRGETGFPLVDAGMRQMNATGWMHNRVRMLCASFLVKDLHLDWRLGEAYFMTHLVDGDLASNNGGWQWAAGCGADAAPYFRHFNPYRQSQRFDPDGEYIRRWVPELAQVPDPALHQPGPYLLAPDYPAPMVDHKAQAAGFTQAYKLQVKETQHAS
ncbi:cryptochrome/photolyase family protein [Ferrimonas balearica]|uniref:cryptochrome/photolyase family protein n=1 Tax=Ferrimonas balearica TaxID=44012 RepID=UPI001C99E228|nr:FAD-binding domain-containing protein [Ferrimonas balearica]MBY5992020.1 deoxyribodipyrimidine photo-lyase [Ferrimonas balearica]